MNLTRKLIEKIWYKVRRNIIEILKSPDSEKKVAFSFALGTFISAFPTPGFTAILAALVAISFKSLNKFAILLSLIIWNTFTMMPLYWMASEIGALIFNQSETVFFKYAIINTLFQFSKQFLIGGAIVTIPFVFLNYALMLSIVKKIKNRKLVHGRLIPPSDAKLRTT